MTEGWPEVGTVYAGGIVETGPDRLNVPVGSCADGVCLACHATGMPQHDQATSCPYLPYAQGRPGRPLNPLRDAQEREDRKPSQSGPPTGEGQEPAGAG